MRRIQRRAQKRFDPTTPLTFRTSAPDSWPHYHVGCGGDVDRTNSWTAYCDKCGRMVHSSEIARKPSDDT